MRTQLALAVSAGVAGFLAWSGVPAVGAAPGWSPPQALSVRGSAEGPQVAVAVGGQAVVVWEQETAAGSRIVSAARDHDGAWHAPVALSAVGARTASGQQVAVDDHGVAVATWERGGRIFAAVRNSGGLAWSRARQISPGAGGSFPQVAVTVAGRAYVVWQQVHGTQDRIVVVGRSGTGVWSRPTVLASGFGDGQDPQIAVDALGHATVVWQRMWADGGRTAVLAARSSDGRWGATRRLSPAKRNASGPLVAMNERGDTVVTWSGRRHHHPVVMGVIRPPTGPWRAARAVVAGSPSDLALGRTGAAVVAWTRAVSGVEQVGLARRPAGGTWHPGQPRWPVDVQTATPVVALGGGATALAWMTDGVRAARQDGGTWGTPADLGGPGVSYYQQVAINSTGRAVVVWKEFDGARDVVMMSSSDPS